MLHWYFYSDTNAPTEEIESILGKRQYTLKSFYRLEDLHEKLKQNYNVVLFIKSNTIYNVYDLCQEISIQCPHAYIIMVVPDNMENIKKAMHVGASDILRYSSDIDEKKEAVIQAEKYMSQRMEQDGDSTFNVIKNSKVISVCSTKGGVGRTMLTVNLATAMAKQGKQVAILDANLQFGDVAMFFDLKPKQTIYEWVKEGYERENYLIDKYLIRHESSVSILAAPPRPEFFEMITENHMKKAVEELKRKFDIILIDTPAYLSEVSLQCLEHSDEILLLLTGDLPVLRSSKLLMDTLETFQLNTKVKPILNREMKNKKTDAKKIEELLGGSIYATIPNQENLIASSINEGIPFIQSYPRTPLSKSILLLATNLTVSTDQVLEPRKKRKALVFG
jgi:pilus assembly protein CpaE